MKKNSLVYILHIRDSVNKIIQYTKDVSNEEFNKNSLLQDAVIRHIEIIGEASKNIPDDIKIKYKSIPWKRMIGMRNKVIHEYFGVRLSIVWNAIKLEIPSLKKSIDKMILEIAPKSPLEFK